MTGVKKIKVCMVALRHSALDCRIFYKEARTLRNNGYNVHIICRLKDGAFTDMGGNPVGYPDENGEWNYDGITFHGIKKRKGIFGKWQEYKDIVKIGLSLKTDVYHCHESDIALVAAIKIKKLLGQSTKLIYDIHEYWPDLWRITAPYGLKTFFYWLFQQFERRVFDISDYLITVNTIIRGYALISNPFKNVEILWNFPELSIFQEKSETKKDSDSIVICHEGALNFNRGLKEMVSLTESDNRIKLKIIGTIKGKEKEWLERRIKDNPILSQRIEITGWLPYEEVGNALASCDIGLIIFYPTMNNVFGSPNKLFNYMRYGIPVVSVDLHEVRAIINKYKCGIIVKKWDTNSLIESVRYLVDHPEEIRNMGERGKSAVLNELCWEKQEEILLKIYEDLLNPKNLKGGEKS